MSPHHPAHATHLATVVPQVLPPDGVLTPGRVPVGPDIVQLIVAKEPATSALCMVEGKNDNLLHAYCTQVWAKAISIISWFAKNIIG